MCIIFAYITMYILNTVEQKNGTNVHCTNTCIKKIEKRSSSMTYNV